MTLKAPFLVITDLDGTLLDHNDYSFESAVPALRRLEKLKIPVIPCSSKTAVEIKQLNTKLKLSGPFIFENGGGIYLPDSPETRERVIQIGRPVKELGRHLDEIERRLAIRTRRLPSMSIPEIEELTHLSPAACQLARAREFSLPFLVDLTRVESERPEIKVPQLDQRDTEAALAKEIKRLGLTLSMGGRFLHLTSGNDKGIAVERLRNLYASRFDHPPEIMALGDSQNDLSMLKAADYPVRIVNPESRTPLSNELDWYYVSKTPAPGGWAEAISILLDSGLLTGKPV